MEKKSKNKNAMEIQIGTVEEFLDKWCLEHQDYSDFDLYILGTAHADPDDIFNNIMTWKDQAISELIYKLLKARKIPVSVIIDNYVKYMQSINIEKSETIDELSVNLCTFRHKMYTTKDIEDCNERADKILKKCGWERNTSK